MIAVLLLLSLFTTIQASNPCSFDQSMVENDSNYYMFAQTSSAAYCLSHQSEPGCQSPTKYQMTTLQVHGLWLSEYSGKYLECCQGTSYTLNETTLEKYMSLVVQYWTSEAGLSPVDISLPFHECSVHGSCTSMDPDAFMHQVLLMASTFPILQTPDIITNNFGKSIPYNQLVKPYGEFKTSFICLANSNTLSEVRTCFDLNYKQIDCPPSAMKEKGQCDPMSNVYLADFSFDKMTM